MGEREGIWGDRKTGRREGERETSVESYIVLMRGKMRAGHKTDGKKKERRKPRQDSDRDQ